MRRSWQQCMHKIIDSTRSCTLQLPPKSSLQYQRNFATAGPIGRVRGTRDLIGKDAEVFDTVANKIQTIIRAYGFQRIQTPIMEYTDVFSRSLGDGSDIVMKEMYTFEDKSGNSVTLRPEGTAGVMRAALDPNSTFFSSNNTSSPTKVYYAGSMFRYERPQKGRFREFQQLGIEVLNAKNPSIDIEVVSIASDVLKALNLGEQTALHLNTLGDIDSRVRYRQVLLEYFESHRKSLSADSQDRLDRGAVLRILDSKATQDKPVITQAPTLLEHLSTEAKDRFDYVQENLKALGIEYTLNPHLVRGLDYYSNTVFEFIDARTGLAVLAGGSYDQLSLMLNGKTALPCIGWACGIDRLSELYYEAILKKNKTHNGRSIIIGIVPVLSGDKSNAIFQAAMNLANEIRQNGHVVQFCHPEKKVKKQMKAANAYNCTHVLIIGESELVSNEITLKCLETGKETKVDWDKVKSHGFE